MNYEGELYGKVGSKYIPLKMRSIDVDKLQRLADERKRLLNDAFVFLNMPHKALEPWRMALDQWSMEVSVVTGWDAYAEIKKHREREQNQDSLAPYQAEMAKSGYYYDEPLKLFTDASGTGAKYNALEWVPADWSGEFVDTWEEERFSHPMDAANRAKELFT